jgi:hypothetical protein
MNNYFIGILVFLFCWPSTARSQQDNPCQDVRKGNFYCSSPNGGYVYIQRKKKKQIEKYNDEKQRFYFKIQWLDDCSYKLTLSKTKKVERAIRKQIIGTTATYYILELKDGYHKIYFVNDKGEEIHTVMNDF